MTDELPEHVAANRAAWDLDAANYVAAGERSWREQPGEETWGLFGLPESGLRMLPDDLAGLDAIELGCGTAYVSAWLPEAARLLRPGGRLHVLTNSVMAYLASPDLESDPVTDRLLRPQFGMGRITWPGETSVEFHPTHGDWVRMFTENGFEVLELLEPQVPADATTRYPWMTAEWASRWPCEDIWKVRKRG